jgi:hypothetical protein
LEGQFETIRGRRLSVDFNLLNWIRIGKSSERKRFHRVELGPTGEVVVEEGELLEKTSYRWDEIQFLRLLYRNVSAHDSTDQQFVWTFGRRERFARRHLVALLKTALQLRSISEFDLPGAKDFPLQIDISWLSRFSERGIGAVRDSSVEVKWQALIRSLELVDPERYGRTTFWRDWIVSAEVRELIQKDPVQSHLESRYPIPGRTEFERRQVVTSYRKVRRFLELVGRWRKGDASGALDAVEVGMDVPIFVWFHLLCPQGERSSVVVLTGDLARVWGEDQLLDFLQ